MPAEEICPSLLTVWSPLCLCFVSYVYMVFFFFFFQRFVFLFKQLLLHGEVLLYHMVAFKFFFFFL